MLELGLVSVIMVMVITMMGMNDNNDMIVIMIIVIMKFNYDNDYSIAMNDIRTIVFIPIEMTLEGIVTAVSDAIPEKADVPSNRDRVSINADYGSGIKLRLVAWKTIIDNNCVE